MRALAGLGSGADIVSGGELHRTSLAGIPPDRVVYSGVGKTREELTEAIRAGILSVNIENLQELEVISRVAESLDRVQDCSLRVNPDVDPHTHEKTTTGTKENKFGISIQGTWELVAESTGWDGVELKGVHMHLGSPVCSTGPYEQALAKIADLVSTLRTRGHTINVVNIGGGYPISYTGGEVPGAEEYAAAVKRFLEKLQCEVIIEPGRYISGPSGLLLVRVLYRKESDQGKKFVICDGGMNDLIRPTLYGAFQRIWPVKSPNGMPEVMRPNDRDHESFDTEIVDIVGPICESGDFFAKGRPLPVVSEGDILGVFDTGAYGSTMSSNYNGRPRAAEVLVDAGKATVIRRRETYEDLIAAEQVELSGACGSEAVREHRRPAGRRQ